MKILVDTQVRQLLIAQAMIEGMRPVSNDSTWDAYGVQRIWGGLTKPAFEKGQWRGGRAPMKFPGGRVIRRRR